jgi:hypothetical protein
MVTITSSTLRTNVYEYLYDTLTSAYLLSSTVTVTAAYIDSDNAPFPQVVLHPIDIDKSDFSFDRTISKKDINVMIDIWTKKNKDKDQIADEIDNALGTLKIPGIHLVGWSESNALETPNENKIHLKTITLTYIRA